MYRLNAKYCLTFAISGKNEKITAYEKKPVFHFFKLTDIQHIKIY